MIYGLITLGLIVLPTQVFQGTPLFCTPCLEVSRANAGAGLADMYKQKGAFNNEQGNCAIPKILFREMFLTLDPSGGPVRW